MTKKPQKVPRSARPTRAERQATRRTEKRTERLEKQRVPSAKVRDPERSRNPTGRAGLPVERVRAGIQEGKAKPVSAGVHTAVRGSLDAQVAECPACGDLVELLAPVRVGGRVTCPECGQQLAIISRKPLELDYAFDYWEDEEH